MRERKIGKRREKARGRKKDKDKERRGKESRK